VIAVDEAADVADESEHRRCDHWPDPVISVRVVFEAATTAAGHLHLLALRLDAVQIVDEIMGQIQASGVSRRSGDDVL
jgi:hypothetical protein